MFGKDNIVCEGAGYHKIVLRHVLYCFYILSFLAVVYVCLRRYSFNETKTADVSGPESECLEHDSYGLNWPLENLCGSRYCFTAI